MKKIIITGSGGLLGQYLCKVFADKYQILGLFNRNKPDPLAQAQFHRVDLMNFDLVQEQVQNFAPDIIIHTAGLTDVDCCQETPDLARDLNVTTSSYLVKALEGSKGRLIFISSDHLFGGRDSLYLEESPLEPINVYAQTKIWAEQEIVKHANSQILRTNFYGGHSSVKKSFSSWIINELRQSKKIEMFCDVNYTPISMCTLADNIELMMLSQLTGIYNLAGAERLTKFEFAKILARVFSFDETLVMPLELGKLPLKAKRPLDMSLSIEKIKSHLPNFIAETAEQGLTRIRDLDLI